MKYATKGISYYRSYEMPLCYSEDRGSWSGVNTGSAYRILYLDEGEGVFSCGSKRIAAMAPFYICLKDGEGVDCCDGTDLRIRTLIFQPQVINANITSEAITKGTISPEDLTTYQDMCLLRPFIAREKNGPSVFRPDAVSAHRMHMLFGALEYELLCQISRDMWPCRSRSYFMELLFILERTVEGTDFGYELSPGGTGVIKADMESVILHLKTRFSEKLSLDGLAREFATNRTTLSTAFKEHTGRTVIEYLTGIRIDAAALFLRNTELKIMDIMERSGFTDRSHFTRTFKKITGLLPSEYRDKFNGVPY